MVLLGSGGAARRSIGRTAGGPDIGAAAPTADQKIALDRAGALSKIKIMKPGPPEGPRRVMVATNGAQRAAGSRGNVTGKSVPMGFRAHDMERDSIAALFKFNNFVYELRGMLDSGERLLRPVGAAKYGDDLESVAVGNLDVGTAEDPQPDWDSSLSQRLERAFD